MIISVMLCISLCSSDSIFSKKLVEFDVLVSTGFCDINILCHKSSLGIVSHRLMDMRCSPI